MDFILTFRFLVSIIIFGLLWYLYSPIIEFLNELMPTSGPWSSAMFFLWMTLPGVNLFVSGIRLVQKSQEKSTWMR